MAEFECCVYQQWKKLMDFCEASGGGRADEMKESETGDGKKTPENSRPNRNVQRHRGGKRDPAGSGSRQT